jgi:muramidase (phage lysozyme)
MFEVSHLIETVFSAIDFAIQNIAFSFVNVITDSFQVATNLDKVREKLQLIEDGSSQAQKSFAAFVDQSSQLGTNVQDAVGQYIALKQATTSTVLEPQSKTLVNQFQQTFTAQHLDQGERTQALDAITGIASGSPISREFFTNTLPKSFPSSLGIAARSQGMTQDQFLQLVEQNGINKDRFIPQFAAESQRESQSQLSEAFDSPLVKIDQFNARVKILQDNLGTTVLNVIGGLLTPLNALFDLFAKNSEVITTFALVIGVKLVESCSLVKDILRGLYTNIRDVFGELGQIIETNLVSGLRSAGKVMLEEGLKWGKLAIVIFGAIKLFELGKKLLVDQDENIKKTRDSAIQRTEKAQETSTSSKDFDVASYKPTVTGDFWTDLDRMRATITDKVINNPQKSTWDKIQSFGTYTGEFYNLPSYERNSTNISQTLQANSDYLKTNPIQQYNNPDFNQEVRQEIGGVRSGERNLLRQIGYKEETGQDARNEKEQYNKLQQKEQSIIATKYPELGNLQVAKDQIEKKTIPDIIAGNDIEPIKNEKLKQAYDTLAKLNNSIDKINAVINETGTAWLSLNRKIFDITQTFANLDYKIQNKTALAHLDILDNQIEGQYGQQGSQLAQLQSDSNIGKEKEQSYKSTLRVEYAELQKNLDNQASGSSMTNSQEFAKPDSLGKDVMKSLKADELSPQSIQAFIDKFSQGKNTFSPDQLGILKYAKQVAEDRQKYLDVLQGNKQTELSLKQTQISINQSAKLRLNSLVQSLAELKTTQSDIAKSQAVVSLNRLQASGSIGSLAVQGQTSQINVNDTGAKLAAANEQLKGLLDNLDKYDAKTISQFKDILGVSQKTDLKKYLQNTSANSIESRFANPTPEQAGLIETGNPNLTPFKETAKEVANTSQQVRQSNEGQSEALKSLQEFQVSVQDSLLNLAKNIRGLNESFSDMGRSLNKQLLDAQNALKEAQANLSANQFKVNIGGLLTPGHSGFFRELEGIINDYVSQLNQIESQSNQTQSSKLSLQDQTVQLSREIRNLEEQRAEASREMAKTLLGSASYVDGQTNLQIQTWQGITAKIGSAALYADKIAEIFKGMLGKFQPSNNVTPTQNEVPKNNISPLAIPQRAANSPISGQSTNFTPPPIPNNKGGIPPEIRAFEEMIGFAETRDYKNPYQAGPSHLPNYKLNFSQYPTDLKPNWNYGRYQNDNEDVEHYGFKKKYKDLSPDNQDKMTADIISDESRFPGGVKAIKQAFSTRKLEDLQKAFDIYNKFWVSLPGGSQNGHGQNIEANLPNLAKVGFRSLDQSQSHIPTPVIQTAPSIPVVTKPFRPIESDESLGQFADQRLVQTPQPETQQNITFTAPTIPDFNQPFNLPSATNGQSPTIAPSEFSDKAQKIQSLGSQKIDVEQQNNNLQKTLATQDAAYRIKSQELDTQQKIRENQRQYLDSTSRSVNELQNILSKAKGYQTYQEQINQSARETTQEYKSQKEAIEDTITQFERMRDLSTENIRKIRKQIDELKKEGKPIPIELIADIKTGQDLNKQIDQLIGQDKEHPTGLLQQKSSALSQAEPIARQSTVNEENLNKTIQAQQTLTKIRSDFAQAKIENGEDPFGALGQEAAILQAKLDNLARSKDAEETIRALGGEAVLGAAKVKELRDTVAQTNQLKLEQAQRTGNKFEANFQSGFEQLLNGSTTLFGRGGGQRELQVLSDAVKTMFSGLTEQASKFASKFIASLVFGNQGTAVSSTEATNGVNVQQALNGGQSFNQMMGISQQNTSNVSPHLDTTLGQAGNVEMFIGQSRDISNLISASGVGSQLKTNAPNINYSPNQNTTTPDFSTFNYSGNLAPTIPDISTNNLGFTSALQGTDFSNVNNLTTSLTSLSSLDFSNANSFLDNLLGVGNTSTSTAQQGKSPQNQDILGNWLGTNNKNTSSQAGTSDSNENPIQATMVALTGNKDFSNTNPISTALASLGNNSGNQTSNNPATQFINQISGNLTPKPTNPVQGEIGGTLTNSMNTLNQQVITLTQSFSNLNTQIATIGTHTQRNNPISTGNNNTANYPSTFNSNDVSNLGFTKPQAGLDFNSSISKLFAGQSSNYLGVPGLQNKNGLFGLVDSTLSPFTANLGSSIGNAGASAISGASSLISAAGNVAGNLLGSAFSTGASDVGTIFSDFIFNTGGIVPNYAEGGQVDYSALGAQAAAALNREQSASGKTPVLAALTPGEYVVPLHEVPAYLQAKQSGLLQASNYFNGGKVEHGVNNLFQGGQIEQPPIVAQASNYFSGGKVQHEVANFDQGGMLANKASSIVQARNYYLGGTVQHEVENYNTGGIVNYRTQNFESGGTVKNVDNFVNGSNISTESSYIQEGHKKTVENHFKGGIVENIINYADGGVIRNIHNSPSVSSSSNTNTLGVNLIQLKPYLQTQPVSNINVRNYSSGGYVNPTIYNSSQARGSDGQNSTVVNNNWNVNYTPNSQDSLSDSQINARNQTQLQRSVRRFGV